MNPLCYIMETVLVYKILISSFVLFDGSFENHEQKKYLSSQPIHLWWHIDNDKCICGWYSIKPE